MYTTDEVTHHIHRLQDRVADLEKALRERDALIASLLRSAPYAHNSAVVDKKLQRAMYERHLKVVHWHLVPGDAIWPVMEGDTEMGGYEEEA